MSMASPLRAVVTTAFQGSQSSSTSYILLSQNLKEHHEHAISGGLASEFQQYFVGCMNRILTTQRKDQGATRVLDFVAEYFRTVCPLDDDLDDNEFVDFAEDVIAHFLPGFEARNAGVRYWCVRIVGGLLPLIALNEDLLTSIRNKAVRRLRDADARVRVQAVILTARFDLEPVTIEPLTAALQYDPSSEVRLAVAYNLAHGGKQLAERVCERVRDESPVVRRALYTKVLRSIDFRTFGLRSRENVVRSGLVDRDPAVHSAASELIAHSWVATADNNIELLLQRLDVITNQEIADLALEAFFDIRRDVLHEKLVFDSDFWDNLWIEDVVLLRNFQSYCLKHGLTELLDERMPELAALAGHIERLWKQFLDPATYRDQTAEQAEDIRDGLPFMVEQLLLVVAQYDFKDEASRRKTTQVLNEIVMAVQPASDNIIENIVAIQRLLNQSDMALMSWAFETLEAISDLNPTQEQPDQVLLSSLLRALSLFKAVLSRVSSPDLSAYLPTLSSGYILPALQSPVADIREPALECLALACLLNERFASEHIGEFMSFIERYLSEANGGDGDIMQSGDYEESEKEMHIATNAIVDMLLVHFRGDLPLEPSLELLQRLIDLPSGSIRAVAALNLAKLMLAKLVDNEKTLCALTLLYFQCDDGSDSRSSALLQQQLNLFLRAYALYPEGKIALAGVFKRVYSGFVESALLWIQSQQAQWADIPGSGRRRSTSKIPETMRHGRVGVIDLVNQIIDLTADEATKPAGAHVILARNLVRLTFEQTDSTLRRSLAASLNKLVLTPATASQDLQSIVELLDEQDGSISGFTNVVRAGIQKFKSTVQELHRQAVATEEREREVLPNIGTEPDNGEIDGKGAYEEQPPGPEQRAVDQSALASHDISEISISSSTEGVPAPGNGQEPETPVRPRTETGDGSGSWVEVRESDVSMSEQMAID